jgi:hypothetical protein
LHALPYCSRIVTNPTTTGEYADELTLGRALVGRRAV